MRIARLAIMWLLVGGLLVGAPIVQHGGAHADPGVSDTTIDTKVTSCCAEPADSAEAPCQWPCLCAQVLAAPMPRPASFEPSRFAMLVALRLAARAHDPDPLPPKPPAA